MSASAAAAGDASQAPRPALWEPHTVFLRLHNLPRPYSCAQLREKLHDVLVRIGAREDAQIHPSRCERAFAAAARSPSVRLSFHIPRAVQGRSAAGEIQAASRTVRLAPGEPPSIEASDCELLRQIKAALPGRVAAFRLACLAPRIATPAFFLAIRALMPVATQSAQAPAGAGDAPRS